MKTFGQRIRELRDEQDLSLRELAKKLKLSPAFLSDIELGHRYPSDKVLTHIARLLGVTEDDLRTYDTRPPMVDLKRRAESDPELGFALRKMIDKNVTSEELIEFLDKRSGHKKKP